MKEPQSCHTLSMSRLLRLSPNFRAAFDGPKIARDVVNKLAAQAEIKQAYLFGSSAEGRNTVDSDLDILVVIPESSSKASYSAIVGTPFFSPVAVDWIFVSQSEFDQQLQVGGVVQVAVLTGVKIFE